jgi:Rad3-related DNA helicase
VQKKQLRERLSVPNFLDKLDGSGRDPRDVQVQALEWLTREWDNYRVFALNVPTGGGKSLIARAIQLATGAPIITPNNVLLDQYVREYKMNYVKGRDHYTSPDGLSCDTACPIVVGDPACAGCPYKRARAKALAEEPTVYNPASLFYLSGGRVPGTARVIDEADLLGDFAKMLCSFSFSKSKYGWTDKQLSELELEAWLNDLVRRLEKLAKTHLTAGNTKEYGKVSKDLDRIRQTRTAFTQAPEQFAIWKEKKRSRGRMEEYLNLQPILPPKHFRDAVLGQGKVILMSGTLFEPDIKELVPGEPYVRLSLKSPIPAARRPLLYRPISAEVNYKTPPETIAAAVDKIVEAYPEQNLLVHLSYGDARAIAELVRSVCITHEKGTKASALAAFKQTGGVILASGCSVGLDLPDDQCRVIYIPRLLKPNLGDPAVKKRKALPGGQEWYDWTVLKGLIQSVGRGCRGPTDYCVSIIGDPALSRLALKYFDQLPEDFMASIQWV